MTYKIYHQNQEVQVANNLVDVTRYMAEHHRAVRGFSKRTLARARNNELANVGGVYQRGNFRIVKINGDNRRKLLKELRQENTVIRRFRNRKEITLNTDVFITKNTAHHVINKVRDYIRSLNLNNMNRQLFKVVLKTDDVLTFANIGTVYLPFNALIEQLKEKLDEALNQYDNNVIIEGITVYHFEGNNDLGDQIIYGRKKKEKQRIVDILKTYDLIGEMVINTQSNKKLLELLQKNKLYSPSTNKNCFIKSCFVAKHKKTEIDKHVQQFVKTHREKITEYTCNVLAPMLCTTLQTSINVHFMEYEIVTLKYGTFNNSIDIVIHQSHAIALIKRDENEEIKEEQSEQELIEKPDYKDGENDFIIATFDMETCNEEDEEEIQEEGKTKKNNTIPYALGFYDGKIYKEFYMKDRNDDIVKRFINYLFKTYKENKIVIYSHNGGKFDIYLLFETILKQMGIVITSFIEQSGRIINLQLNDKTKTLIFRDSINLIAGSLDNACKSFKPKTQKLEGDVIHEKINIRNCHAKGEKINIDGKEITVYEYTSKYLKNDCYSLHEILNIFDGIITDTYNFSIIDVLTNASIARRLYLSKYYDVEKTPLYRLTPDVDRELRKFYYGGRNEVFSKLGHTIKKLFYLDFTSLYPYIMSKYKIQYGKMDIINVEEEKKNKFDKKWFGFVKCRFRHTHKNELPLHAVLKNNKLVFPHVDTWQEAIISTEEVRYSLKEKLGYEYEFIKVFNYKKKSVHFKKIVNNLYKMKIKAQKDKNDALRSIAKIIINSLYGFFGINYLQRDQTVIRLERDSESKKDGVTKASCKTEAKLYSYLASQQLKDYKQVAGYDIYQINAPIKAGCANVGIASMITSYSRMELYKLMRDLTKKGGNVYYCDTDSVVTDYNIYEDEEMHKKWVRSGGDKLGELTNETDEEGGYYNEIITLGNKMYALRNMNLKKEKNRVILKMKGVNVKMRYDKKEIDHDKKIIRFSQQNKFEGKEKITFEDYELLAKGYNMTCDNMNFVSGIGEMVYKGNKLIKLQNTKTISSLYDKADVDKKDNNKITPMIICECEQCDYCKNKLKEKKEKEEQKKKEKEAKKIKKKAKKKKKVFISSL